MKKKYFLYNKLKICFLGFSILFIGSLFSQKDSTWEVKNVRMSVSSGMAIPIGGAYVFSESPEIYKGFNAFKTHNPTISFSFMAETPWKNNWFLLDSLYLGARFSTQKFYAKNLTFNDNLWINAFYITLSRSFNYRLMQPYARIGIGGATMLTSLKAFVISGGGSLSVGTKFNINKHVFAVESTINAPLIAYRNKLTAFWEVSFLYVFQYNYFTKVKEQNHPSFIY